MTRASVGGKEEAVLLLFSFSFGWDRSGIDGGRCYDDRDRRASTIAR